MKNILHFEKKHLPNGYYGDYLISIVKFEKYMDGDITIEALSNMNDEVIIHLSSIEVKQLVEFLGKKYE